MVSAGHVPAVSDFEAVDARRPPLLALSALERFSANPSSAGLLCCAGGPSGNSDSCTVVGRDGLRCLGQLAYILVALDSFRHSLAIPGDPCVVDVARPWIDYLDRLIGRLRANGIAILLSEQNAEMTLAIADRAYVMETGSITLQGSGRELRGHPEIVERYLGIGASASANRRTYEDRHVTLVRGLSDIFDD